jgi:hypothetical protein
MLSQPGVLTQATMCGIVNHRAHSWPGMPGAVMRPAPMPYLNFEGWTACMQVGRGGGIHTPVVDLNDLQSRPTGVGSESGVGLLRPPTSAIPLARIWPTDHLSG